MSWKQRSQQKELIDLGPDHYTSLEYAECLDQLGCIGQTLGGDRASFGAFSKLQPSPRSILDVGCGGGFFARRLAERYPQATVLGIDLSAAAIQYAKDKQPPLPNLQFQCRPLDRSLGVFDVVTSTLVCHHLTDQELVQFLREAHARATQATIINDLHRHPLASASFALVAPLFFRNRLIRHDGALSIHRAFTRNEWLVFLQAAGLSRYSLTWQWAFRWILTIY